MPDPSTFLFQPTSKEYEKQKSEFEKLVGAETALGEAGQKWYGEAEKAFWMEVERGVGGFITGDEFRGKLKSYDLPGRSMTLSTILNELKRLNPELTAGRPLSRENIGKLRFPHRGTRSGIPAHKLPPGTLLSEVTPLMDFLSGFGTNYIPEVTRPEGLPARTFPSFEEARRTGTARYMPIEPLTESPSLGELLAGRLSEIRESADEKRYTSLMQLEDIEERGLSDLVKLQAQTLEPGRSHEGTVKWTEYLRKGGVPI